MNTITIVYFSGTGGTKLCAEQLSELLAARGNSVQTLEIRGRAKITMPSTDKVILMYPVYFANAPLPVQEFIHTLESVNSTYAAVISVSAGGDVAPNLACRMRINAILADKGYNVVYENMLVMPANCLKKAHDIVTAALLKVLPHKLKTIADDIADGKIRRPELDLSSHVATQVGCIPQKFSGLFALFFKGTDKCNGCGLCARTCPRDNIYLEKGQAKWEGYCAACMNCFYICPQQAIKMRLIEKKFVIEGGYNIKHMLQAAESIGLDEINEIAKLHTKSSEKGIRKYLLELQLEHKAVKGDNIMIKNIATGLYEAYQNKQQFAIPSAQIELDEAIAYAIQKEYAGMRAAQGGLAGYKAAMTSPASRAKFGVNKPLAASLYKEGVLSNGAILNRADYANLVLETELVYFADCDISKPFANVGELRSCFTTAAPGIEIASSNFADGVVTGNDVLCVNANSTQVIVGSPQAICELDMNKLGINFYHNGVLAGSGTGADALECQWKCLLWLVNKIIELGYNIKKGDVFFTGALGQVLNGECGDYNADFGALGKLEFKVQ